MAGAQGFIKEVDTLIRARYPLLYLITWEEQRVEALLGDVARNQGKDLLEWSRTRGLNRMSGRAQRFEGTEEHSRAFLTRAVLVRMVNTQGRVWVVGNQAAIEELAKSLGFRATRVAGSPERSAMSLDPAIPNPLPTR